MFYLCTLLTILITFCVATCKSFRNTTHHYFPHATQSYTPPTKFTIFFRFCSTVSQHALASPSSFLLRQTLFDFFQATSTSTALNDPFPLSFFSNPSLPSHPASLTFSNTTSAQNLSAMCAIQLDNLSPAVFLNTSLAVSIYRLEIKAGAKIV